MLPVPMSAIARRCPLGLAAKLEAPRGLGTGKNPVILENTRKKKGIRSATPNANIGSRSVRVIWAPTIAIFLGTITIVALMFLLYADRELIRDALRKTAQRRLERRTAARVSVELSSLSEPRIREITLTRNVSRHGACVLTKNCWLPNSRAGVRFLYEDVSVRARIAYCKPWGRVFVIGLQFSTAIDPWITRTAWAAH